MASDLALTLLNDSARRSDSIPVDRLPFLSTLPAGLRQRRLALWVVLVSGLIFAAAAPFARLAPPPVPAFLPVYQSALVVIELITAVLLFDQFAILRSRALLVLASAYLFSAFMAVAHALSFPGLFAPTGVLGAGGQTTAWLYFLWHGIFPLLVIAYALSADAGPGNGRAKRGTALPILAAIGAVALVVCGLVAFTTAGHDQLPPIMQGNSDAPAKVYVATACWMLTLAALPVLWRRRPLTVLDLWLMVVLWVWVFDIALASVLNHGRHDLGWYAGRVYGLLAASFVLIVLLLEKSRLCADLVQSRESERRHAQDMLARHSERLRILREIDRAIVANEPAQAIAGAVIQPLRQLLGVPRAIVNMFDLAAGEVEWMAASGRRRNRVGPGVRYSIRLMGDVDALKRGEPQIVDTHALPPGPEVEALLASGVQVYMAIPMIAGGELIGALSFGGEPQTFPAEQIAIAQEVATQLAIAITQARLFERVKHHADELEARVNERTAELKAVNRELESFSYSVSHDLRAPLRAVDGYALMLQEDYGARLDDEGRRLLGVVRASAGQMGRLIDDLLRFSQVGRKALAPAPVDMRSLAGEVVAELAGAYPKARIDLGDLPSVAGDRALLRQVWTNLIGNALKYSARADAPRVEISGRADGPECVYQVRDNGAGFDMRYYDKLFRVFQRLHREEDFEGTGVGLAIVQRVVVRHGGRIWGESAPGQGACFHFALPKGE
jgi:signal transduction histidine kinase